jgi:hypothetical protein
VNVNGIPESHKAGDGSDKLDVQETIVRHPSTGDVVPNVEQPIVKRTRDRIREKYDRRTTDTPPMNDGSESQEDIRESEGSQKYRE